MPKPTSKFASEFLGVTAAWHRAPNNTLCEDEDDDYSDVEFVDEKEDATEDKVTAQVSTESVTLTDNAKIAHVDKIFDSYTGKTSYVPRPKTVYAADKLGDADIPSVVVVARAMSDTGEWAGYCDVSIHGKLLCTLLTEICNEICDNTMPIKIVPKALLDDDILRFIFYARSRLDKWVTDAEEKLKALKDSETEEEKKLLEQQIFEAKAGQEFIQGYYATPLTLLKTIPEGSISFNLLWTLFTPGMRVFKKNTLDDGCILRVQRCFPRISTATLETESYEIGADFIEFDGKNYGFIAQRTFHIRHFEGNKQISELSIFPLEYHPSPAIKKELVERGDNILRLNQRQLQEYKGDALYENGDKFVANGRVMVDPISGLEVFSGEDSLVLSKPIAPSDFTDDHKMLLSPLVYGFSMATKTWGHFSVSNLQDVQWDENAMDKLEIPEDKKAFIKSLIRVHGSDENTFDDIVPSKGKGLVGLLSGPSGVGKSLTAEVLAEVTHRPLYVLSPVELGENPQRFQQCLLRVLKLKVAWNAILLIDEAEVFLGRRRKCSRQGSSITSILLRSLEYHRGIVLLTTNRLEVMDDAFKSRIHFHLKYEEPDQEARSKIWETFFAKIKTLLISDEEKARLAQRVLNGRQIKNAVSVAQALALEKDEAVTMSTIETALSFSTW